jgi:putative component of toxin-antitoxin plasmid stabilization module
MGADPVNLIDPSGGSILDGLNAVSKAGVFMLAGAFLGLATELLSGGDGWTGAAIGAGIGLGSSFSFSITAKIIKVANAAGNIINTANTTTQAGATVNGLNERVHGPNPGNMDDDCCKELWDEIKDAAKETFRSIKTGARAVGDLASDIYKNGVTPALDWVNHTLNPVYLVWNAGYSHFTGRDFLNQTPIDQNGTLIDAALAVIPFGKIVGSVGKLGAKWLISSVKQDTKILKLARETFEGNDLLRKEANALLEQLSNGNMNPGMGTKAIGKNIFEARGKNGTRVYFRNNGKEGVEIVGYSNKSNQQTVINRLLELYQ